MEKTKIEQIRELVRVFDNIPQEKLKIIKKLLDSEDLWYLKEILSHPTDKLVALANLLSISNEIHDMDNRYHLIERMLKVNFCKTEDFKNFVEALKNSSSELQVMDIAQGLTKSNLDFKEATKFINTCVINKESLEHILNFVNRLPQSSEQLCIVSSIMDSLRGVSFSNQTSEIFLRCFYFT